MPVAPGPGPTTLTPIKQGWRQGVLGAALTLPQGLLDLQLTLTEEAAANRVSGDLWAAGSTARWTRLRQGVCGSARSQRSPPPPMCLGHPARGSRSFPSGPGLEKQNSLVHRE